MSRHTEILAPCLPFAMELRRVYGRVQRMLLLTAMLFTWGVFCSEKLDKCSSHLCQNGATCVETASTTPGTIAYTCICPPGLTGADCAVDVNECESAPCRPPHSLCVDHLAGYTCHCPHRWGSNDCPTTTEDCSEQPCLHGGSCLQQPKGFECICAPGFRGVRCQEDVDECQSLPCQNGALCQDGINTYHCFCVPGFQGYNCEVEINECASRPCTNNATCVNGRDRYVCQCMLGYTGVNCELEIDECASRPCQNGATCHDHLGRYTCACLPGYKGLDCEINIDDCVSDPCLNGGICIDQVDSYECNCGGTGFTGAQCEEDIPECASNPCQHNSTCMEGVNLYTCQCWPGYMGERCEVDVDECAAEPCENGGECLQRSDWEHHTDLQPAGWEFSYSNAAGYICLCLPGFMGENCSVNMDECESRPCQNGGTCVDLVDGYTCVCLLGFTGPECQADIDECASQPCQNGALCQDSVADYACLCPKPDPGGIPWGGRHCHVQLVGCTEHKCENGATCVPLLGPDGKHGYSCNCPPGFHGDRCAISTTFSFLTPGFLLINMPPTNANQRDLSLTVTLRLRTTLPNVVIFYRGDKHNYLSLEISNGNLLARALVGGAEQLEAGLPGPINDGEWHKARVNLGMGLQLELSGSGCNSRPCVVEAVGSIRPSFLAPPSFIHVYLADAPPELLANMASNGGFLGCMEDLMIDSWVILPQSITLDQAHGMVLGCSRTERCHSNPCSGHGRCVDLWSTFFCDCYSPFHGDNCSEELPQWTFSREDSLSYASYVLEGNHGTDIAVSLLLRSRNETGLLLQLWRDGEPYLTVYLDRGRVYVSVPPSTPIAAPVFVTTGEWQPLMVEVRQSQVVFNLSGTRHMLGNIPEVQPEAGDVVYVGGLPPGHGIDAWGGHFKGCLQDVRLDSMHLAMDPWSGTLNTYLPHAIDKVETGCISDDKCQGAPCQNGGQCLVTWNDFVCSCNINFTGKTCKMLMWCASGPCATGSRCVDKPDGYECLMEATFDNNALQYSAGGSLIFPVTNISMDLRTRAENCVLLQASDGSEFFRLGLRNGSPAVEIHSRSSVEPLSFASDTTVADGIWHHVHVSMADPRLIASPWVITVDHQSNSSSTVASGSLDFLNGSMVFLAETFVGCLGEVRVGGVYLPFADIRHIPQRSHFLRLGGRDIQAGCTGPPVCLSQPCLNGGTCKDLFGLFNCACAPGWEGQYCQDNVDDCASMPCFHGACRDLPADFECLCPSGYQGKTCEEDIDDCQGRKCENGGTCQDGVNSYTCICPADFRGPLCEWSYPLVQCNTNVNCIHGECSDEPWGANCSCRPGYMGERCETEINECESNPCQHGGSCLDQPNMFLCTCASGFMGPRCETSKQEQRDHIPWLLVAIPLACCCLLLASIGLTVAVLTARRKRRLEGAYSPSQQEGAGARLEMDNVFKVPPEERLI